MEGSSVALETFPPSARCLTKPLRTGNVPPMTPGSLPALVEASARRDSSAPALVDGSTTLSYGELCRAIEGLARMLAASGVRRGDRVGILAPKSADAVTGMLSAMRAGAAYVPVDPTAPMRRARAILADAGISALFTTSEEIERRPGLFAGDGAPQPKVVVLVDGVREAGSAGGGLPDGASAVSLAAGIATEAGPLPGAPGLEDLAYILYTSGSTGQPMGVTLSHRNALAFVEWAAKDVALTPADRVASHAPFHFDLSVFDLYATFLSGASVHLVPSSLGYFPLPLAAWNVDHAITVWYSVPSILSRMAEQQVFTTHRTRWRTVIFAGEVFPLPGLRALQRQLPGVDLLNWYGPTETNVCTYYRVPGPIPDSRRDPLPIGVACPYAGLRVVDDAGADVPRGEKGELWVSGDSVLAGYWNDEERSRRSVAHGPDGGRHYRTGDIVRWDEDGQLAFLGRRDSMVKVRGYRVELGDVEAALQEHPEVIDAVVVPLSDGDGQVHLVAIAVRRHDTLATNALLSHVVERLSRYMVPERVVWMDALPRTSTGKVDRVGLKSRLESGEV